MMASSDLPFVAEEFGGGVQISKYPVKPIPLMVYIIFISVGFIIGVAIILLYNFLQNYKEFNN